jgi:small-conductance mechanosensitive channel
MNLIIFGNSVFQMLETLGLFVVGVGVAWVVERVVLKKLQKWSAQTETPLDDFVVEALRRTLMPLLSYGVFYFSVKHLTLSPTLEKSIVVIGKILIAWVMVRLAREVLRFGLNTWAKKKNDASLDRQMKGFMPILTFAVWVVGILVLLDNLGFKITTVLAGLGIGGIAVALASQAILGDLFGYFAILLDKPFEVGDFIIVNEFMGTVEYVGIKTTRIRSLGGEQLVLSNTDLTSSRVRNYKRMELRRIVFKLGVVYNTSLELTRMIPGLIKEIIQKTPETRFDRAHFFSFDESCLTFEVVYFVLSADYNRYMDVQQSINLEIKSAFEARGIDFAFPTRTLYVNSSNMVANVKA